MSDYYPFNSSPLKEFITQSVALLIMIAAVTLWIRWSLAKVKERAEVCPVCHQVYYPAKQ